MSKQSKISGKDSVCDAQRIRRAAAVIAPLIFLSVFIGAITVSVANDMYAFVKPEVCAIVLIEEGSTALAVGEALEAEGIIKNPHVFAIYAHRKGADRRISEFSGELEFCASMSYREIIASFS